MLRLNSRKMDRSEEIITNAAERRHARGLVEVNYSNQNNKVIC